MPGNFWKDKRVFVTGISGFVGSRLALRLIKEGAYVVGLTRNLAKVPTPLHDIPIFIGDICDADLVRSIISYEEIDIIYHLAANAIVRSSAKDPLSTYKTNVMGTANLLEAARQVGVRKIIVASSDKAYGDHDKLPYMDTHALQPKNTYDTSKACMDMISRSYAYNYDMNIVVTRCSNIYGPGDMNLSRLIPNTIKRSLDGKPAMIYSDISNMEREFIYIDDVVEAYCTLGLSHENHYLPSVNIGGSGPKKILEVVNKIREICNSELEPEVVPREPRFKEIQKQYIDASRMAELGWEPTTSLDEGLRRTVEWYTKYYKDGEYS